MQLLLNRSLMERLHNELRGAGRREIGGLLMGEHVDGDRFRIVDFSVQRTGGTRSCFIRNPRSHDKHLEAFFERTNNDYTRFNYLGEWHSHPGFAPLPSTEDLRTMQSIVDDTSVGVNFLVLLIARLAECEDLELTATAFRPGIAHSPVNLVPVFESVDDVP